MSEPRCIIIDCDTELVRFLRLMRDPCMPTVDIDAALDQIVDAVLVLEGSDDRLSTLAYYMGQGEGLSEHWIFEDQAYDQEIEEKVIHTAAQLGVAVRNNLLTIHAYRSGKCPYLYGGLINDTSIRLCKTSLSMG